MNEEETTHLRSYLTSQSLRRTPEQLIEILEAAYMDLRIGVQSIPASSFRTRTQEHEWSGGEILEHVQAFFEVYKQAICAALEAKKIPQAVEGAIYPLHPGASRETLLQALETSYLHLKQAVLFADPSARLSLMWSHFELGPMHWREWLLFTRIHLLEHVRQVQDLGEQIAENIATDEV